MTEIELFDKLNPKRDLPQATCDIISIVYKILNKETEQRYDELEKRVNLLFKKLQLTQQENISLRNENAELKEKLNRYNHDCISCSAFGKHCPHLVNGDPYFYDCYLTVGELEKENTKLKAAKFRPHLSDDEYTTLEQWAKENPIQR